jgi:hypothetical protein
VAVLTIRRLRTVGLPLWLAGLSVVPLVNVGFFLILTVLRNQSTEEQQAHGPGTRLLDRILPDTEAGSAIAGILLTSILGVLFVLFGTNLLGSYGWALFILLPFFLGFLSVLFYGYRGPKSLGHCLGVSALSVLLVGVALLALAVEGLVCLLMAMPIALPLALLGGSFAYLIQRRPLSNLVTPQVMGLLILTMPALMGSEKALWSGPDLIEVRTAVIIDAAPEQIWPRLVALDDLPEPDDWLLRHSIAYPVRTETRGQGPGAVRLCVFSTGPIVEPVLAWEYARRLRFSIIQQPPLMRELSPYEIRPPHLEMQFLRCREGQFVLDRLPEGRTRLEGTSWYEIQLWPAAYWRLWTDRIAHRIHLRVLDRVKMLAEREPRS